MIGCEIVQNKNKITGLDKLFEVFPRDFSFEGAYLKGVLLHENNDLQLTYCIKETYIDKTYILVFILSGCLDNVVLCVPTEKTPIIGIDVSISDDDSNFLRFADTSNKIMITCKEMRIDTHTILSEKHAKEQAQKLTKDYSERLNNKIKSVESLKPLSTGKPLFRRDDSYNGIFAKHHTMYKLEDLHNKDNSIVYEFLIELDRNDPCLGIYYGCKGLIKKGDNFEKQSIMRDEWEKNIKENVLKRLNNVFPEKKFKYRFKPTDNANDNTFWPFWISLYEDENILEVAVRATIIIRDEYKRYLEGDNYASDDICKFALEDKIKVDEKIENPSLTRFTFESWKELLNPQEWTDKESKEEWASLLNDFISGSIREKLIEEKYEKGYQFNGDNICLALMLQLLVNRIRDKKDVPWEKIGNQFLDKKGNPFGKDSLKSAAGRYWSEKKNKHKNDSNEYKKLERYTKWSYEERQEWENRRFPDKYTIQFKKIMDTQSNSKKIMG